MPMYSIRIEKHDTDSGAVQAHSCIDIAGTYLPRIRSWIRQNSGCLFYNLGERPCPTEPILSYLQTNNRVLWEADRICSGA